MEPHRLVIRLATPSDAERLCAIERAAVELFRGHEAYPPFAADGGEPDEYIAKCATQRLFVGEHGGEIVGFVEVEELDGEGYLHEVDVDPAYGRRGFGAQLVAHAVEWSRARGLPSIALVTLRDVPWNAPFYAKLGFVPIDEEGLTPGLRDVRAHEAAKGFPMHLRVFMRRAV